MREFEFIDWIRSQSRFDRRAVPAGPGDDMAVVDCAGRPVLLTTDQVLDGVHFVLARDGAQAAGRKAMARSLSDVAAMAAVPVAAVATVALPVGLARERAEAVYLGLREAGDAFGCPIVGGDVASWDAPLAITTAVLARPGVTPPILRQGARPGDAICVTGAFGGAWRTSRHLTFTPRVAEALILAERYAPHAMIDVSDGLAADLGHICRESAVGAEVLAELVPVHADASGRPDPLAAALGDGEDYELLFTLPPDRADRLLSEQPLPVRASRIGTIVAAEGLTLLRADGRREELPLTGWEHRT